MENLQNAEITQEAKPCKISKRRQTKLLADYVRIWADTPMADQFIKLQMEEMGIENPTNKVGILFALLRNVNERGDTKSIQMLLELMGEDRKYEAEITKLKSENERLKKEINGEIIDTPITIVNNIPNTEN